MERKVNTKTARTTKSGANRTAKNSSSSRLGPPGQTEGTASPAHPWQAFAIGALVILLMFCIFVYAACTKDAALMKQLCGCIPYTCAVAMVLQGGPIASKLLARFKKDV